MKTLEHRLESIEKKITKISENQSLFYTKIFFELNTLKKEIQEMNEMQNSLSSESENISLKELSKLLLEGLREDKNISVAFVQKKLSIGYSQACRLVDYLEANSVITPKDKKNHRYLIKK